MLCVIRNELLKKYIPKYSYWMAQEKQENTEELPTINNI